MTEENICKHAFVQRVSRRGEGIFCNGGRGYDCDLLWLTEPRQACIATTARNTGHCTPDVWYAKEKMYSCPWRKGEENE